MVTAHAKRLFEATTCAVCRCLSLLFCAGANVFVACISVWVGGWVTRFRNLLWPAGARECLVCCELEPPQLVEHGCSVGFGKRNSSVLRQHHHEVDACSRGWFSDSEKSLERGHPAQASTSTLRRTTRPSVRRLPGAQQAKNQTSALHCFAVP